MMGSSDQEICALNWESNTILRTPHCILLAMPLLVSTVHNGTILNDPTTQKHFSRKILGPSSNVFNVWSCSLWIFLHWLEPAYAVPSALCWLGGNKSICPVKNRVMGCWRGCLSEVRCRWLEYGPADATATPSFLASVKSRMVYPSGASLPTLSLKCH